jgi:PncC family amidohydrolase
MSDERLERVVGDLLRAQGLTLSTAESCTGGLIGHRLTNVSGSSDYFLGGVVCYSNEVKASILKVRHDTLDKYGAVSEQTALEMARSVRELLGSDVAVSVTGIAGPTGSSPDKPVGLVYIALSAKDKEICQQFVFGHDREGNKAASAEAALKILETYLRERTKSLSEKPVRKLSFLRLRSGQV